MIYNVNINAICDFDTEAESEEDAKAYAIEILNEMAEQYGVDFKFRINYVIENEDDFGSEE
ncbi:hypothetical protein BKK54_06505 [Rodentibacter genomosp. 1]|uniref:Uncharacterized protein n=2 Tax=Pasteurellaceae TaxID=712 RepID=A0A1V3J5C6_9PAST|nr:hypothetical protein BKK54_06505 [Rodentibacter genomosp. 1]OOF65197.1 hypothetical protein BH925_05050 [Rodentibacter pneumotropicus]